MKILAIDSSGLVASAAVAEDDRILAEYTMNYKITHSETLLPMIDEITRRIELDLETLDAIAVSAGPGSFTGLRIGSATAKGIGLALKIPIISVPTVDALAYNLWGSRMLICPIMDARRNQVYTGLYHFTPEMDILIPQKVCMIDEIMDWVNSFEVDVCFIGDGVPVFRDYISTHARVPVYYAPAHMNAQRAAGVAALGRKLYEAGNFSDAASHKPEYLRLSQAERERQEKERDFRI